MKKILSIKQSAELVNRGISSNKASEIELYDDPISQWTNKGCPLFTLADIFSLLPTEIYVSDVIYMLEIHSTGDGDWSCGYERWNYDIEKDSDYVEDYTESFVKEELIDALFELLCWVIDNKYIKLDCCDL